MTWDYGIIQYYDINIELYIVVSNQPSKFLLLSLQKNKTFNKKKIKKSY